jgi:hypothetical protein
MTVKDFQKYQKLAEICDGTFGKPNSVRSSTESVTLKMTDDTQLVAKFIMVVNFGSENQMRQMMPRFKNEATSMVKAALDQLKEKYKDATGKNVTLKLNQDTLQDSVEFLSYQIYNPKKTAYYRLSCVVDVK